MYCSNLIADDQLSCIIKEFFVDGIENVSATIQWACAFLIERPDVQVRMRKEIEEVVGTTRRPNLSDRQYLHYCEAAISEIIRCGNMAPLPVLHTATDDFEWQGYTFPKDCLIFFNLDTVHWDPDMFPEPRKFKPERFLSEDGKFSGMNGKIIPFGVGEIISIIMLSHFFYCIELEAQLSVYCTGQTITIHNPWFLPLLIETSRAYAIPRCLTVRLSICPSVRPSVRL